MSFLTEEEKRQRKKEREKACNLTAEQLEKKRARNRKANMSDERYERHLQNNRKANLTTEQIEKKNAKNRKINMTPEQIEKKRLYNRSSYMDADNLENRRNTSRRTMKQKRDSDPIFKLMGSVSRMVNFMLKSQGTSKSGESIQKYLLWTKSDLKIYVEAQFEPWMNWDNHGVYDPSTWDDSDPLTWTWQLDHIVPHSSFPYSSMKDDNFKKCWALSNLRPLSAKQNIIDGVSRSRHLKNKEE